MQTDPKLLEKYIKRHTRKLIADSQKLPKRTPILLADKRGKIHYNRRLEENGYTGNNVSLIICEKDKTFYIRNRRRKDSLVLEMKEAEGRDFLVLSKTEDMGIVRGVVCSCSPDNCMKIEEYIERVSRFKDYMSSFPKLIFSEVSAIDPIVRITRLERGSSKLMELSSQDGAGGAAKIDIPLEKMAGKIAKYSVKTQNGLGCSVNISPDLFGMFARVPLKMFELLVLAMVIVVRYSMDKKLVVSAGNIGDNKAKIRMFTDDAIKRPDGGIVFVSAVIRAFNNYGYPLEIIKENGGLCLETVIDWARPDVSALAESDEMFEVLSRVMESPELEDMMSLFDL